MYSNRYVIAIAGPSCAGKSELSKALAKELCASVLAVDSYYRDLTALAPAERARVNFDSPDALDHELLVEQVQCLSRGGAVQRPVYNFASHTRAPHGERFIASDLLIVEGMFALYWHKLRQLAGTKIFVDASDDICFHRRKLRDVAERGRTLESVIAQFRETVQPMAARHVRPTSAHADLVLSGEQALFKSVGTVIAHVCGNLPAELIVPASAARNGARETAALANFTDGQR